MELSTHAVLFLDFQNDIAHDEGKLAAWGFPALIAESGALENAAKLLDASRAAGAKIVHGRVAYAPDYSDLVSRSPLYAQGKEAGALVEGTWGAETHDRVLPQPGELVITRQQMNVFHGGALREAMGAWNIDSIVVAGVATNFAVEDCVRSASTFGYDISVARDCCASMSPEAHGFSMDVILTGLANRLVTTEELVA